jgi:hypothetical protein
MMKPLISNGNIVGKFGITKAHENQEEAERKIAA